MILLLAINSCVKLPVAEVNYSECKKIQVGSGPEDMVLDTLSSKNPRILVSCSERRIKNSGFGEIFSLDISTGNSQILPRKNNPDSLVFRPHGIDLVKNIKGKILLYCISHNEKMNEHSIIIYKVFPDRLEFQQKLDNPLLVSPNDVAAAPSGEIFVTNDSGKRGSMKEALFKLKRGTVVMFNPENYEWKIFAKKLLYANGIAITGKNEIVVSTVRQNALFLFHKENPEKRKIIAPLFGLDNISFANENEILVTSHPSLYKFLKHYKDSGKKSPTIVYKVNLYTGEIKTVYSNDGSQISAASTAIWYNGKLYISQVFEPFILECR